VVAPQLGSCWFQECPFPQFFESLLELHLCVHHDRAIPGYGFLQRLARNEQNRMPSSPAYTATFSPESNKTSERLPASVGGAVSSHFTPSVGTARGPDALQNLPLPAKT